MVKKLETVPLDASIYWHYLDLFRNIKVQIILEVFKSNHLQAYEKEYWRLGGRFTKK